MAMSAGQSPREMHTRLIPSDQWCLRKLLRIKWYHHVQNDEVRRTTGQPHLSAIAQARRFSLFSHIVWMPDETDAKKILTASSLKNWRRPPGHPRTTWTKTIQQDLKSNNLSLNLAIDGAQNRPLWRLMSTFGTAHSWWCTIKKKNHTRLVPGVGDTFTPVPLQWSDSRSLWSTESVVTTRLRNNWTNSINIISDTTSRPTQPGHPSRIDTSVVTKTLDVETEAKIEAAGFETEAMKIVSGGEAVPRGTTPLVNTDPKDLTVGFKYPLTYYRSFRRWSSKSISWQPSQPITSLILAILNITTTNNNSKT